MKKLIAATLLAATAIGIAAPAEASRRRAVRPGPPAIEATYIAPTANSITITNYDTVPASIEACLQRCTTPETLAPGATKTYDISNLGANNYSWIKSNSESLEARTDRTNMAKVSAFSQAAQAVPIVDLTKYSQELLIFSKTGGSADIARRAKNGVQEDIKNYSLNPGLTRIANPYGVAASNEQLEIRPSVPISALLEVKNESGTAYFEAKQLGNATGSQFLTSTQNATAWIKATQNTFHGDGLLWPSGQDNSNTFQHRIISTMPEGIENTTINTEKQSSFEVTGAGQTPLPFAGWAIEGNKAIPFIDAKAGAIGRSGVQGDVSQRYEASLNKQGKLTIVNTTADKGNVTGKIQGYDATGNQTTNLDYTLGWRDSRSFDITAARTIISVNDAVGSAMIPQVIATVQSDNIVFEPYQIAKSTKVTGEDYVKKWLDPILNANSYLYFNKAETTDLFNSEQGHRLMQKMYRGYTGNRTFDELVSTIRGWVNGNFSDGEICQSRDPLYVDFRLSGGFVRPELDPNCNGPTFSIISTDLAGAKADIREFYAQRVNSKPEQYGGTVQTGPSLEYNPTISTQDSTPRP